VLAHLSGSIQVKEVTAAFPTGERNVGRQCERSIIIKIFHWV
jgi:hypothetical protein